MKTLAAATVSTVLVGLASFAQAAQLVSPPLPTNSRVNVRHLGACRILNTGTTPVTVQVEVFSNNSLAGYDIDTCNQAPLAGGHSCLVMAGMPDDSYAACKVTAPSVIKLRGTFEMSEETHEFKVRSDVELQ